MSTPTTLESLHQLSLALGVTLDAKHESAVFMDWLKQTLRPRLAALFLVDETHQRLNLAQHLGFKVKATSLELGLDPWRWLREQGVKVPTPDDPRGCTLPITLEGELLGLLAYCSRRQAAPLASGQRDGALAARSRQAAPLASGQRDGALAARSRQAGREEEQHLAELAVGYFAPHLRNIYRYRNVERLVEQRTAELRASEERYRTFIDATTDLAFLKDDQFRYLIGNETNARFLGKRPEEIIGRDDFELMDAQAAQTCRQSDQQVIAQNRLVISVEAVGERVYETRKFPVQLPDGRVGVGGYVRDITELKRAEQAVQDSEKRFRALIENGRDNISLLATDGTLLWESPATVSTLGYAPNQFVGRNIFELMHPDDQAWTGDVFEQLAQTPGSIQEGVFRLKHSDGSWRWIEATATNLLNEPSVKAIVINYRDITARKLAEEEIYQRAAELAALQATILDITTPNDLQTLLRTIVERAAMLIKASGGGMYLCDVEKKKVRCVVSYNTPQDYTGTVLNYGEGAAGVVAETREPLIINDYRSWHKRANVFEKKQPFSAVLSVPMIWQNQTIGVIHVLHFEEGRIFTQDNLRLLTLFANHAAVAVESTRLYEASQHELAERKQAEEALRQSEERYRNYIELANDFIFTLDSNGLITSANKVMRQMLGYSETELLGKSALEFVAPQARAIAAEALSRTLHGEDIPHIELPVMTGDNRQLILEIRGVTLYGGQEIIGTLHIARDITERVKAEQALRESESKLKEAQRLGRIGHWEYDLETRQISWSDMVFAIYERDPGLGAPTPEEEATYYSPEDAERLHNYAQKTIETGEPYETDVRLKLPGGRFAELVATSTPVKDAQGRVVRLLGTVQDITHRKQAEAQLRLQNTALEASANAIVITDPQGFIQWANPAFTALTGYIVPDEVFGRNPRDLVKSGKQDKRFYKKLWDTILAGKVWRGELINRRKDGMLYAEEMTITPVKNEAGEITHFIAVKQDITPRKRREREMEAMLRVSQAIGGLTELQPLLENLLEAAIQAIPAAEKGTILLADAEGGLQIRAMNGYRDQRVLGYQFPLTSSYAGRAFRERRPLIIGDAQADPNTRYDGEIEEIGAIRSAIVAPLIAQKYPIGVISLDSTRSGEETLPQSGFTEDDLRLLTAIAAAVGVAIENVRLFEETQQRLAELTAVHQAAQKLTALHTPQSLAQEIVGLLEATVGYEFSAVLLIGQDGERLIPFTLSEQTQGVDLVMLDSAYLESLGLRLGKGITGWVAQHGQTVRLGDVSQDDRYVAARADIRSELCVPLRVGKRRIIGVVNVESTRSDAYSEADQRVLETIAAQISVAIENARLFEETQQRLGELETLQNVSAALRLAQTVAEMIPIFVIHAVRSVGAQAGSIYLLEESSGDWVSRGWLDSEGRWVTSQDASLRHRRGEGVTGRVGSSGEIYITIDNRTDPITKPLPGEAEFLANFISAISLPLRAEQHIIGVLHVWFTDLHTFTESEQRLLTAIADMAGNALQRASLHQETQRRAEETSALLETSQAITLLDLGSVLQTIGERAKVLFAADGCRIFLLEPDGETLSCALALHERAEAVMRMHIKVGEGITGAVATSGEAEIVNDTLSDRRSVHVPGTPQDENECLMLMPLKAQERVIGVMSVSRLGIERPFQPAELELLRAMAAQASVAIENARLYKETQDRLQQLAALHTIDRTISNSLDLRMTLRVIAEQAAAQLQADAAAVLLLDQHAVTLKYAAGYGFRQRGIEQSRVPLGTGLAGRAAIERCTLSAPHLSHEDSASLLEGVLVGEGFLTHHVTPLIAKGEVKGVLEVYHRAAFTPQTEWIGFFEAIATQAAIAIDNAQLLDSLQRSSLELSLAYSATIEGWAKAMEMRDEETEGHTLRVTELTLQLAQVMNVPDGDIIHIRRGALLHDIGKIGVPDSILRKPGKLSAEEWEIMRRHPQSAYEMLQPIEFLRLALDIPYCHHEKWDGSGYPRGLKGEQIPIAARIFAIADVFDALTSERPYRPAWSREKALAYIREQSGKHFDPQVVRAFLSLIEKT